MTNPVNLKPAVPLSKDDLLFFLDDAALEELNTNAYFTLDKATIAKLTNEGTIALILSFLDDAALEKFGEEGVLEINAAAIEKIKMKISRASATLPDPTDPKATPAPPSGDNNGNAPAAGQKKN